MIFAGLGKGKDHYSAFTYFTHMNTLHLTIRKKDQETPPKYD